MQKHNGDKNRSRGARQPTTIPSPARLVALGFVLSVVAPIGWGLAGGQAQAQQRPANLPSAPRNSAELIVMAATAAKLRHETNVDRTTAKAGESPRPSEAQPAPEADGPGGTAPTEPEPQILARATENPELAEIELPPATNVTPSEERKTAPADETPELLAQAAVSETRVSAAALLQRAAAAPQLSAVGAVTSRSAREAASVKRSSDPAATSRPDGAVMTPTGQSGETRRSAASPTPATQKEIEAARAARARAVSGGVPQTTRRRVAMHRMAAAAASSLNEATPFRTGGSGSSRFASDGGDSLGDALNSAADAISVVPGLRLENVELSAGYSSNGLPGARSVFSNAAGLGSDMDYNARATLAFRKRFRTSSFGMTYTPSRNQRYRYSQWNSTDHVLGLRYDRQLGRRWGLALNANAANTGLEQFWFRAPTYHRIDNPPKTFEELVQRVEAGEFTDDEFASLMTGAPVVDDPGGLEIDLARVNSLNSTATVSYAHSARSNFLVGIGASRYENATILGRSRDLAVNNIQRQFGYLEYSYRFSPNVTTGFRYNAAVNDSTLGNSIANSASMFVRRRLSRFWSMEINGGGGYSTLEPSETMLARVSNFDAGIPGWLAGGRLRYRYAGHSFEVFGQRQIGDNLGLSSRASLNGGVSWEWTTPRIPWIFSGGASYSKSDWGGLMAFGGGSTTYETSLLQAGLSRRLSANTAFSTGYYFGRYQSPFSGLLTGSTIHRVQASFLWRPVELR